MLVRWVLKSVDLLRKYPFKLKHPGVFPLEFQRKVLKRVEKVMFSGVLTTAGRTNASVCLNDFVNDYRWLTKSYGVSNSSLFSFGGAASTRWIVRKSWKIFVFPTFYIREGQKVGHLNYLFSFAQHLETIREYCRSAVFWRIFPRTFNARGRHSRFPFSYFGDFLWINEFSIE